MSYDSYDIATAAQKAGVSPRTIQRRIESGRMPGATKLGGRWIIPEPTLAAAFPQAFATKTDKHDTKYDTVNDTNYDRYDSRTGTEHAVDSQLVEQLRADLERERARADRLEEDLREERASARASAAELVRLADQSQQLQLSQMRQSDETTAHEQQIQAVVERPATQKPARTLRERLFGR